MLEVAGPQRTASDDVARFLLVEDSPSEAALTVAAVRRADRGAQWAVASTLAEACAVLRQEAISCVLLDLGLPDAQGFAALDALQAEFDVPIVVLTGWDDPDTAIPALARGAQDYLVKGRADPDLLIRTLRYAVERHQAERRARQGQALARAVLDAMDAHTAVIDHDGVIVSTNLTWEQFADRNGGSRQRCGVGTSYLETCRASGAADVATGIESVLVGQRPAWRLEYPCPSPDAPQWFEMRVRPVDLPTGAGAVITHTVVTEFKQAQERLTELASRDPLTGLANRSVVLDAIGDAVLRVRATGSAAAVIFLDLDRFKNVNDSLGHAAGDVIVQQAAQRLVACARSGDTVARFGGDEFVVVCTDLRSDDDALTAANRFREALARDYVCDGHTVELGASVGIAFARDGTEDPQGLLDDADMAMYQAKQNGRDRVHVFEPAARERARQRFDRAASLREALQRDELEVHYQPQVELATDRLVGVEALVRWRHEGRLAAPAEFMEMAERTGIIAELDRTVLHRACHDVRRWISEDDYDGVVSVNLFAGHLSDERLLDVVLTALEDSGLPANRLVLEVTETAIITELERAAATLGHLRSAGVRIAVDDFGTGYSSMANLRHLPVDALKVDRTFVAGLGDGALDRAIVRSTIQLAEAMSATVVAEGVERDDQRRALADLGCHIGQGFLWAPAMPEPAMRAMVQGRVAGGLSGR